MSSPGPDDPHSRRYRRPWSQIECYQRSWNCHLPLIFLFLANIWTFLFEHESWKARPPRLKCSKTPRISRKNSMEWIPSISRDCWGLYWYYLIQFQELRTLRKSLENRDIFPKQIWTCDWRCIVQYIRCMNNIYIILSSLLFSHIVVPQIVRYVGIMGMCSSDRVACDTNIVPCTIVILHGWLNNIYIYIYKYIYSTYNI